MDKALVNPIEDQRKEALRHYDEAARLANYWSSFVRNAILAYNPTTMDKQDKTAERYFKCWKCGKTLSLHSGITCTQPMAVRTSGMCGGSTTQEITKDEYFETLYKWSEDRTAELEAKVKALEEQLEAADEVLSCVPLPNDMTFRNTYISGFKEALEKYQSLKQ